ncbi:dTMP kinase [Polymorphobacter sp.]|uniref:dTMP kinase n=1 Tax=Polymorphobacter sp. TaxID=1909290 RepID=UPI003F70A6DB
MPGRFISLEGGEGSGKSTQAHILAETLSLAGHDVVLTREPGGTAGAEAIRALLVSGAADRWSAWSEACLVNAARADHVDKVIRPALARGAWVVCDRFIDSTRAYQGAGKGLPDEALLALHAQVTGDLWPHITFVLTLDPGQGLARAETRARERERDHDRPAATETRFESHDAAFHARIAGFFTALPEAEPARCIAIDASGRINAVASRIHKALEARPWP